MLIRLISDGHLEFSGGEMDLPKLDTDKDTVLVLAGDIGLAKNPWTYVPFLEKMSERFYQIVYIMGNHEFYKGNYNTTYKHIANNISHILNTDIYENESVVIGNVAFVCCTLWSGMNNADPMTIVQAETGMNDYKQIRHGPPETPWQRTLHPRDTIQTHLQSKDFLLREAKEQKLKGKKVVVVTHHACHVESVSATDDDFRTSPLIGAYYTEMFEDIMDIQPDYMLHGHMHQSSDYKIGNTQIYCNPRGYFPDSLNPDFNTEFIIEV